MIRRRAKKIPGMEGRIFCGKCVRLYHIAHGTGAAQ